jgi:hypothetical protein
MSTDSRTSELVDLGKLRTRKLEYLHQYVRLIYVGGGKARDLILYKLFFEDGNQMMGRHYLYGSLAKSKPNWVKKNAQQKKKSTRTYQNKDNVVC